MCMCVLGRGVIKCKKNKIRVIPRIPQLICIIVSIYADTTMTYFIFPATAGVNHHVCLWNPYVVSKPNGVGTLVTVITLAFRQVRGSSSDPRTVCTRVATVRKKYLENEIFSMSGKSLGILWMAREI